MQREEKKADRRVRIKPNGHYLFSLPPRLHQRLRLKATESPLFTMSSLLTGLLTATFKESPPKLETAFKEMGVDIDAFYNDEALYSAVVEYLNKIDGQIHWAVDTFGNKLPMQPKSGIEDNGAETEKV